MMMTVGFSSPRPLTPNEVREMPIRTRLERKKKLQEYIVMLDNLSLQYEREHKYYNDQVSSMRSFSLGSFGRPPIDWEDEARYMEHCLDCVIEAEENLVYTTSLLEVTKRLLMNLL
jgi:hypothetical protein